ncbi:MAG: PEP-utilizing enzyme [Candidatus Woesearchaeota archaeon]
MKFNKLVEREGSFLKNYLLYESFASFNSFFSLHHPHFLTSRQGKTFTHYLEEDGATEFSKFLESKSLAEINELVDHGKNHSLNLVDFSKSISNLDLNGKTYLELNGFLQKYFELYKKPYPYFHLSLFGDDHSEDVVRLLAEWRLFARQSFNKSHELIQPLFIEISKKTNFDYDDLLSLSPEEINTLISLKHKINNRGKCYFLHKQGEFELVEGKIAGNIVLNNSGNSVNFINSANSVNSGNSVESEINNGIENKILKGFGTMPGKYQGKVCLIHSKNDMYKINLGDIIVTRMTIPPLIVGAIKKAKCIITDEGGMTCHAVVVSRELGIPALIGTKYATKVLKDGDEVMVDCDEAVVRILNNC